MSFSICSAVALPTADRSNLESAADDLGKEQQRRPFFERTVMRCLVQRSAIPSPHSEQADLRRADLLCRQLIRFWARAQASGAVLRKEP